MDQAQVVQLQQDLNKALGLSLVEDGIYGYATRQSVIVAQAQWGLVPDGVAGPKTLAELKRRVSGQVPTLVLSGNGKRFRIILVRGKLGGAPFGFSLGMDALKDTLNLIPGVTATVDNYGFAYNMVDDFATALAAAKKGGFDYIGCIGHSMGADTAAKVAWMLQGMGLNLDLMVAVDPTPFGCPTACSNIVHAVGYHNTYPFQLGGHILQKGQGFHGVFEEYALAMAHIQTDDAPVVHHRVIGIVNSFLARK